MEQALSANGVQVETAATDDDGLGRTNGKPLGVPVVSTGATIHRYFHKTTDFYKISLPFARWIAGNVGQYDVIHVHALFSFTSIVAARAARRAGVPCVIRPLGVLNRYGVTQRRPWVKRVSLKLIEGPLLHEAAAVHFTSEAEKREAETLGIPMRGVVIPLGVESDDTSDRTQSGIARNDATKQSSEAIRAESALDRHLSACFHAQAGGLRPRDEENRERQGGGEAEDTLLTQYTQLAGMRVVLFLSRLDPKKNMEGLLHAFHLLVRTPAGRNSPSPQPSTLDGEGGSNWIASSPPPPRNDVIASVDSARQSSIRRSDITVEGEKWILLIAGDGDPKYVRSLKQMSEQLGLSDRVVWAGYLEGESKVAAFAAANVFVLPSHSENFGMAAAEALMHGLPCVLGKGVALAEEVEEAGAGLAVDPDPEAIAAALEKVLSDESLRMKMSQRAKALAQNKYSMEAMGKSLVRLYEDILARKPAVAVRDS